MARIPALEAIVAASIVPAPDPLLYRVLKRPVRSLLERAFDLTIEGAQNVPASGPFIIAANHHNYLDGILLAVAVSRPIAFLVMPRVYRATPLHPLLHRHIGSIPINVERPDVGALRRALAALDDGRIVGIFPEGPFSVRGRLEPGLHGVALLALRSGVPVLPAGIRGTYEALVGRRAYIPRRHPLAVRFGAPRRFSDGRASRSTMGGRAAACSTREASLLPDVRGESWHREPRPFDGRGESTIGRRDARAEITACVMDDIAGLLA